MALPPIMPGKPLEERVPLTDEQRKRKIDEIDTALRRATLRRAWYRDNDKPGDAAIQDSVIDRRLRERFELMGPA